MMRAISMPASFASRRARGEEKMRPWPLVCAAGAAAAIGKLWADDARYTDPPLGRAGMTEAEVRKTGKPALISTLAMEHVSRAREKSETKGFMKILVDRDSKQLLGASFLGLAGDEAIHCVLDIMYAKAPYPVLQRAMHIHPTVSEFIPTMLGDLKPLQ